MAFHARDGFCFERHDDGSVEITKHLYGHGVNGEHSDVIAYRAVLPPNEWASVVATVSQHGESYETWQKALGWHGEATTRGPNDQSQASKACPQFARHAAHAWGDGWCPGTS